MFECAILEITVAPSRHPSAECRVPGNKFSVSGLICAVLEFRTEIAVLKNDGCAWILGKHTISRLDGKVRVSDSQRFSAVQINSAPYV